MQNIGVEIKSVLCKPLGKGQNRRLLSTHNGKKLSTKHLLVVVIQHFKKDDFPY